MYGGDWDKVRCLVCQLVILTALIGVTLAVNQHSLPFFFHVFLRPFVKHAAQFRPQSCSKRSPPLPTTGFAKTLSQGFCCDDCLVAVKWESSAGSSHQWTADPFWYNPCPHRGSARPQYQNKTFYHTNSSQNFSSQESFTPLLKFLRTPKIFCFRGLYQSTFTALETKTEKRFYTQESQAHAPKVKQSYHMTQQSHS